MTRQAKPAIDWAAGGRYVIGFVAGLILGLIFTAWKTNGLWSSEFVVFCIVATVVPPFVWLTAHVDRVCFMRQAAGLSATFVAVGLLSWLPAFVSVYAFRLLAK